MAKPTRKKEGLYELSTTVLFWTTLTLTIITVIRSSRSSGEEAHKISGMGEK